MLCCHVRSWIALRASCSEWPRGAVDPIYPLRARRRPRRVRFWRLVFLSFSLLEVSLKFIPDPLLVSLSEGFCRKSVCVLLISGCFTGAKCPTGCTSFFEYLFDVCFSRICSFIILHTCTFYFGNTYKCAVTVCSFGSKCIPKASVEFIKILTCSQPFSPHF